MVNKFFKINCLGKVLKMKRVYVIYVLLMLLAQVWMVNYCFAHRWTDCESDRYCLGQVGRMSGATVRE